MLIRVRHSTGKIEQVTQRKLQKLLDKRAIVQFVRSSKWVTVGFDATRKGSVDAYVGPERRS